MIGTPELIAVFVFFIILVSDIHAIIDIFKSNFKQDYFKFLFLILILLFPVAGYAIYFMIKKEFQANPANRNFN